jgi:hypothetical protein
MFNTQGQEVKDLGNLKSMQPGVRYAKIVSGVLKTSTKKDKKCLELFMESEPLPNFEGWPVDRDNPDGPKYAGQTARVVATIWTEHFNENNLTKNEIMSKLTVIAQELGLRDKLNSVQANTIDEWVEKAIGIIKDHYAWWFFKGTEEEYNGKTIVKISLPKYKFVSIDPQNVEKFDKTNKYHYKPLDNKPVSSFSPVGSDFDID